MRGRILAGGRKPWLGLKIVRQAIKLVGES